MARSSQVQHLIRPRISYYARKGYDKTSAVYAAFEDLRNGVLTGMPAPDGGIPGKAGASSDLLNLLRILTEDPTFGDRRQTEALLTRLISVDAEEEAVAILVDEFPEGLPAWARVKFLDLWRKVQAANPLPLVI